MPHFTVVPVKDRAESSYDSLEGINWVDYRDTGQDYPDHQDTVSSDGKSHNFHSGLYLSVLTCVDLFGSWKSWNVSWKWYFMNGFQYSMEKFYFVLRPFWTAGCMVTMAILQDQKTVFLAHWSVFDSSLTVREILFILSFWRCFFLDTENLLR